MAQPAQLLNAAEDAEILDSGTIGLVAALFFVASGAQNHKVQRENHIYIYIYLLLTIY